MWGSNVWGLRRRRSRRRRRRRGTIRGRNLYRTV
jgi:hypothetical protein